jgi:1-aminocyclopropane-1-carboxylate deaminase/D-cysteine desulfhydrase-like pyridoxal-dependent ACC family enzyme
MNSAPSELLKRCPEVAVAFPRIPLGQWPTPVTALPRLAASIGLDSLAAKREDTSAAAYGGNKVRKLEFALGAARALGAAEVVTFGAVGSNHALATAIFATKLGMRVTTFMTPQPPSHHVRHNVLGHVALGARVVLCDDGAAAREAAALYVADEAKRTGVAPHLIPMGGTDALTTLGSIDAGMEFAAQVAGGAAERPDVVYVPFGSMGTAVGVMLGMAAAGLTPEVRAVRVTPSWIASEEGARRLADETMALLARAAPSFPVAAAREARLTVVDAFFGEGYGVFSAEGRRATELMRETEGLVLEGTYTAKTVAALIADAGSGALSGRRVAYWHTYNSVDMAPLIAGVDYRSLPEPFHAYFTNPVQPLDGEADA